MGEIGTSNQVRACSVCGELTDQACADCVIDFDRVFYVCPKPSCRDLHRKCEVAEDTSTNAWDLGVDDDDSERR